MQSRSDIPYSLATADLGDGIRLSSVVSALSFALDLTEGQAEGHAARSCLIGMRIAAEVGMGPEDSAALYYALLLKDLGCSSNASRLSCILGGDDRQAKCDLKTVDWRNNSAALGYIVRNAAPGGSFLRRAARTIRAVAGGKAEAREMVQLRCDRGADIANEIGLPQTTCEAIRALDEHWDGQGYPRGLRGEQIPLAGRILNLAQTVEVFWRAGGPDAAVDMAAERSGRWFDPELCKVMKKLRTDAAFWTRLAAPDVTAEVVAIEPAEDSQAADDDALDRLAGGFARVIDAKSPWTYAHSAGVAEVAIGIGNEIGLPHPVVRSLRRAALLHDIGKLGVSNTILDKPGRLDDEELTRMRRHPEFTHRILWRVPGLRGIANIAASHHERLDGKGYFRGLSGEDLPLGARILAAADVYEALTAKRPYRKDLTPDEVMAIVAKEVGAALCPLVHEGLLGWLGQQRTRQTTTAAAA